MYEDPRDIRDHVTKVRLNEETDALLSAMAKFHRTQKAALARELLMDRLREMMAELDNHDTGNAHTA